MKWKWFTIGLSIGYLGYIIIIFIICYKYKFWKTCSRRQTPSPVELRTMQNKLQESVV